jgi:MFS family permease
VLAPGLAGVLAAWQLPLAYAVDVATFAGSLLLLARVRSRPAAVSGTALSRSGIGAGLRYAASRRDLLGSYAADLVAMTFAMPEALFPFLADELRQPRALGLLYAAPAAGGVLATLTSGWTARVHRHGRAILVSAAAWGAALALAGLAGNLWLLLGCLAAAGAADMTSGIFRLVLWNQTIPDELRGRLAGIELLSFSCGPAVGNARAGLSARLAGVRWAIGGGGLACLAGIAVLAALLPALVRYDSRTGEVARAP